MAVNVSRPLASIVIVSYNGWPDLERCLTALARDPFCAGASCEILLLDNGSSDGSADLAATAFPHVRVLTSPTNLGFGAGNNLAAGHARGEYLAFLNPDTVVETGWLQALIAALQNTPGAGLATSKILLREDPAHINTCGGDLHLTGLHLCRGMGLDSNELAEMEAVGAVSGAAFALRRDLFLALGGFDGDFFMYVEDSDLSWRARLAGYTCLYVPDSVVHHRYSLRFGPLKTYYQERNRYLMLLKTLRWPTLLVLLPALLLAEVVTWGYVLLSDRPHWRNKLRAYGDIVRRWPAILEQRRQVQALRRVSDHAVLSRSTFALAFEQTGAGLAASLAHWVFDPLFWTAQRLTLAVTRW